GDRRARGRENMKDFSTPDMGFQRTVGVVERRAKPRTKARLFSALILGVVISLSMHVEHVRWHARGRDAFLASQGHRFDIVYARSGIIGEVFGGTCVAGATVGAYELITLGILGIVKRKDPGNDRT